MDNTNTQNNNNISLKDNMTDLVVDNPYADNGSSTPTPQNDSSNNQPADTSTPSNDNSSSGNDDYVVPSDDGTPIQLGADTSKIVTK